VKARDIEILQLLAGRRWTREETNLLALSATDNPAFFALTMEEAFLITIVEQLRG